MYRFTMQDAFDVAAEKVGIEGWEGYELGIFEGGCTVKGCAPDGVYSRGPRKGQPRMSKPVAGTKKTVVVSDEDLRQHAIDYEARTGLCFECKGAGEVASGWSAEHGVRMKPCGRCEASGRAKV